MFDISIIVSAHEDRGYIMECLDSIDLAISNFKGECELILAFDGDYDDPFIEKMMSYFDIIAPTGEKSNLAKNYNNAIQNAKGKYIKIMADDDIMDGQTLQLLFDVAEKQTSDLVYSNYSAFGEKSFHYHTPLKDFKNFKALVLARKIATGTCLIKTDSFYAVGGFDEEFDIAEGYCLFLRLLNAGFKNYDFLNHQAVYYRLHKNQKSKRDTPEKIAYREKTMKEINKKYL